MINKFLENFVKSSQNPQALSLTVKGAILGLVPVYMFIGSMLRVPVAETEIYDIAEIVAVMIVALITGYGLLRKIANKFFK